MYIQITPFFPSSDSFRGPFIYDQVASIQRNSDFKVFVFKPKKWYSVEKDYVFDGINVYRFRDFSLPSNILPGIFNKLTFYFFKRKLRSLQINVDLIEYVHCHGTFFADIGIKLKNDNNKIKTIVQHHGLDVLNLDQGILRSYKWHQKYIIKFGSKICNSIDLVVGVSSLTLAHLSKFEMIVPKNTYILYNGVDTNKFFPLEKLHHTKIFNIGCIGNFGVKKDQITLLKALHRLLGLGYNFINIKFIGTGSELHKCKQYVIDNNLQNYVEFVDDVSHDQLINFYNSLNLFVLPSYFEAFGCVYTESYACGIPFIAVKQQGIDELIPSEDRDFWLMDKSNTDNLVDLIIDKIDNRRVQSLNTSINIDLLIDNFIKVISNL